MHLGHYSIHRSVVINGFGCLTIQGIDLGRHMGVGSTRRWGAGSGASRDVGIQRIVWTTWSNWWPLLSIVAPNTAATAVTMAACHWQTILIFDARVVGLVE